MTADIQYDFYSYMAEDMVDNTYNRFMIPRAEDRRRTIVDSDDDYDDNKNPLFGSINDPSRYEISLHVNPAEERSKESDATKTQ